MARDARGNRLKKGDTVSLQIPSNVVVGDVQSVTQGGIVTGMRQGGQQVTAGEVIVLVAFRLNVDPTQDILPNVQKLYKENDDHDGAVGPVLALEN